MIMGRGILTEVGTTIASLMFIFGVISQLLPTSLARKLEHWQERLRHCFYPTMQIKFNEYSPGLYKRNDAYVAIEYYLSTKSAEQVTRLKAEAFREESSPMFTPDDYQNIADEFEGVKVTWYKGKYHDSSKKNVVYASFHHRPPVADEEKGYYNLEFHPKDRELVTGRYLDHVRVKGNYLKKKETKQKLYMNSEGMWEKTRMEHPASFDAFAMDPEKKRELINDLIAFRDGREFYSRIGKAWKRGYLLYGPPGTGKSTLISAMANFLGYDIYNLELTTVKDNAELTYLLVNSSGKAMFIVEDIDCSLGITGKRKTKKKTNESNDDENEEREDKSKVTLSGILNFVDGIWSACGGEKIIVFTTNHVDKLDPALIRKGRMDVHIKLSYCKLEAFKVLARNYLMLDSHPLFGKIGDLLNEVDMTPADISEHLIHGRVGRDPTACLESLIQALEAAKEEEAKRIKKAKEEEEAKQKGGKWSFLCFQRRKKS